LPRAGVSVYTATNRRLWSPSRLSGKLLGGSSRRTTSQSMVEVTTARILADRALQEPCGQQCVNWAVSMLVAGHDGRYLAMLAGLSPPYNHFELADLRDRALAEVGAPELTDVEAVRAYVAELLQFALAGEADLIETLGEVKDMYIAYGYPRDIQDFYSLYFAYDALRDSVVQWYWNGATQENIIDLIRARARQFISEVPAPPNPPL